MNGQNPSTWEAVLLGAASAALFVLASALTVGQLWDQQTPCGSVLNRAVETTTCDDIVGTRTGVVIVMFVLSVVFAVLAYRHGVADEDRSSDG